MDGVLVEAKSWHFEALNRALRSVGYEISYEEHLFLYNGLPTSKKLEMLSIQKGLPQELHHEINRMKQTFTMEFLQTKCQPSELHVQALAKLKKEGYKLAVASNSVRCTVDIIMQKTLLYPYLDFMLSNEDVLQAKPAPEIYLKVINLLNVDPSECLVLEDNDNGIRAAIAAGAHLLTINEVEQVTYDNISHRIAEINRNKVEF